MNCDKCKRGNFVERNSVYGSFFGCSNFPQCKRTLNPKDFLKKCLELTGRGIKIYKIEKNCWKCHKVTPIYVYLIGYQIQKYWSEAIQDSSLFGPPSKENIDQWMMKKIKTIKAKYSKTYGGSYIDNTCEGCGVLQGNFFIFDEPDSLFGFGG